MASGASTSTKETSSAIIDSVINNTSSSTTSTTGVPVHPALAKDSKPVTKEVDKKPTVSTVHPTTSSATATGKDDSNDIVSQTTSGSAPVSVISSAQSMDPSKKDSGRGVYAYMRQGGGTPRDAIFRAATTVKTKANNQAEIFSIVNASRDAYFAVKYNNLLANIAEVGRDVKPAYTNNKSSSERLRKNIVITRNTIRDLMVELEKYSRIAEENDMDYK